MAKSGQGPQPPGTPHSAPPHAGAPHASAPDIGSGAPEIDPSALRDYAPSAAVDRVWRRLDAELHSRSVASRSVHGGSLAGGSVHGSPVHGGRGLGRSRLMASSNEARWQRRGFGWAITVAAVTFGAGIWIGRHTASGDLREVALLSREPSASGARGPDATRPERGGQGRNGQGRDGQGRSDGSRDGVSDRKRAANGEHPSPLNSGEALPPGRYGFGPTSPHGADRIGPDSTGAEPALNPGEAIAGLGEPELPGPLVEQSPALGPVPELAPLAAAGGPTPSPSWQRFANAGEYETALFVLGQNGGFEKALSEADAEQLMLLSDVAWATGQRQRSISALRRVVQEFPAEPTAPLAAWSLAKQLEKVGDKQGALKAFADYRALSPEGDFAEDALVRQMKDAAERGDQVQLKELASQYEREFADGRRAADVARWLSRGNDNSVLDAGVEALSGEAEENVEERPAPPAKKTSSGEKSESASASDKSGDRAAQDKAAQDKAVQDKAADKSAADKATTDKSSDKGAAKPKAQDAVGDKAPSKSESSSK